MRPSVLASLSRRVARLVSAAAEADSGAAARPLLSRRSGNALSSFPPARTPSDAAPPPWQLASSTPGLGHLTRRGGRPPPLGAAALHAPPAAVEDAQLQDGRARAPPLLLGASPSGPRPPGSLTLPGRGVPPADLLGSMDEENEAEPAGIGAGELDFDASARAPHDVEEDRTALPPPTASTSSTSTSTASPPKVSDSDHDRKLSLFYNVYGNPAPGAPGRDESARAARDALALFYATFGPPPGSGRPRKGGGGGGAVADPVPSPAPLSSAASDPARLTFPSRLLRGTVLARPNRFTMRVRLEDSGEVVDAHCPVTGSLGGLGLAAFDGAGVPCLLSRAGAPSAAAAAVAAVESDRGGGGSARRRKAADPASAYARRTRHTVEAVCLADPATVGASGSSSAATPWVGINQMAANRYLEHFMRAGALPALIPDPAAGLAREVVVPGGSRLDFVYGGRDLVEVKSPLEALPLLASAGGEGGPPSSARPNPALVAALAARRSARGSLLSRYPVARRAAMYERAARHAAALADHLTASRDAERLAARRAARAKREKKKGKVGGGGEGRPPPPSGGGGAAATAPAVPPPPGRKARAMLVHCFQFDAPPVRRAIPAPAAKEGGGGNVPTSTSSSAAADGRAAVLEAMRAAASSGVEVWQVNLRLDPDGVSLGDCFALDLFADERRAAAAAARAAARGRARRWAGTGRRAKTGATPSSSSSRTTLSEDEEDEAWTSEDDARWQPAAAAATG